MDDDEKIYDIHKIHNIRVLVNDDEGYAAFDILTQRNKNLLLQFTVDDLATIRKSIQTMEEMIRVKRLNERVLN